MKKALALAEGLALAAAAAFIVRSLAVVRGSGERMEPVEPDEGLPFLSIVVPARNEERQIEACLQSLLAQRYPHFEVIAVNDRSDDRTGEILERLAREHPRLRVIHGEALPEGWIGKPWALTQGADVARGEWLLFTDADTLHEPHACASAVMHARRHAASFLSLLPTQLFGTPGERVLLPTILWMIAFGVGSLEAINDPERLDAAIFNGQYLLVERAAYDAIGGHAAVRDRIAEDYALAQIVKNDGRFHSRLAGASDLVFTRMYRSAREVWDGFSKNLYVAAENKPAQAVIGSVALAAISPLPSLLLLQALRRGERKRALRMGATILATALTAEAGMRHSRFPRGSGLFFPIGIAAMLGIFLNSAIAHRTGRVSWRGRRYPRRTT